MKTRFVHIFKLVFLIFLLNFSPDSSAQGRIVINEFMPWSGCNTTSEFIELMNFGPGPMNIGCYIATNGQYAVTIPPNTVLQPGQYYILSGQNTLLQNCGNTDSMVQVDLNWTTCNCTDKPIPVTGDGFLQDGGGSNEKMVLFDPDLNVVDAVIRDVTKPSPSASITTSSLSGGCASKSFDLDTMSVRYEDIGKSTGVDNSFARKVDGDCGWVKTTVISAHAPNKTGGTSSASYGFNTVSASECGTTAGTVSISVDAVDVASLFPMNYTLAYDKDSNSVFNDADVYSFGVDSSASYIDINDLAYGRYRITVGSSAGCNLKSYNFFIFNCYGIVLPLKLAYFNYKGTNGGQHLFECRIEGIENLKTLVLEGKTNRIYKAMATINRFGPNENDLILKAPLSSSQYFRLRMVSKDGTVSYSPAVKVPPQQPAPRQWPNPVYNKIFIQLDAGSPETLPYAIYNTTGAVVKKGMLELKAGSNLNFIEAGGLLPGIYQLVVTGHSSQNPVSFRFVKH